MGGVITCTSELFSKSMFKWTSKFSVLNDQYTCISRNYLEELLSKTAE